MLLLCLGERLLQSLAVLHNAICIGLQLGNLIEQLRLIHLVRLQFLHQLAALLLHSTAVIVQRIVGAG